MRILMLNHNLIGRGSYLRCFNLARELVGRGHLVEIVTAADHVCIHWETREEDGVTIRIPPRLAKPGRHDGGYAPVDIFARIPKALRRWDLIHAFEHRPNVSTPALISRLRGTPLVTDWSDWWTRGGITTARRPFGFIDRVEGALLEEGTKKASDLVTVVSKALWNRAVSIGIHEERLALVPSGCDAGRITPKVKEECRRKLNLPIEGPVLAFSGFAFWDFEFLLSAFRMVLEDFPEARLLVIGLDKDGKVEGITEQVLGEKSVQVVFAGCFAPDELSTPLGAADIQLLPLPDNRANRARWPIKLGDYLASARPTVASAVGDAAAVLSSHGAGLTTDPSPESMAGGIIELLRDRQRMDRMGENGRKLAESDLSWRVQSQKMEEAYNRCLELRKR